MRRRPSLLILILLLSGLLSGCQVNLYSGLSEKDANEIVAVLLRSGVHAEKSGSEGGFSVTVGESDIARATFLLNARALPRGEEADVGSVFQKSSLISSPFEDRARYVYALGKELAQTLNQIDGVITARVHLVLQDQESFGQKVRPASASVFLKVMPSVHIEHLIPQIRRLASGAIEGLESDAVTVVVVEGEDQSAVAEPDIDNLPVTVLPGLAVRAGDVGRFWWLFSALLLGGASVVIGLLCILFKDRLKMAITSGASR